MASARFRPAKTTRLKRANVGNGARIHFPNHPALATFVSIFIVCAFMFVWLDLKVRPVVTVAARALATRAATDALNQAVTTEISHDADFSRIVQIEQAADGHVQVARFDFASVTELQSAATQRAQNNLRALSADSLQLPLGQVIAGPLVGNVGPHLPIHLYVIGTAHSSVTTDVKSVGVNQTVHILYLDLAASVNVVAPLVTTPITVQSRIPIAYVVLAGPVPNTYLNNGNASNLPIVPPSSSNK